MYELGGPLADRRVPPGTNLLVVGPPLTGKRRLAYDVLAHGASCDEAAIVVTNTDGADQVRRSLAERLSGEAAPLGVVDCVSRHRGLETAGDTSYAASPDDMTGAGIALSEHLSSVDESEAASVRVLVSSVSTLLVYANLETAFRFLHVCTSRIENVSGLGIHLLEDGVHDAESVGTLTQLYDGVVRTSEDDPPEIVSLPPGAESA